MTNKRIALIFDIPKGQSFHVRTNNPDIVQNLANVIGLAYGNNSFQRLLVL